MLKKNFLFGRFPVSCSLTIFLTSILLFSGGCRKDNKVEFGSGQKANVKEQAEQNQSLIHQVVLVTQQLEKHPDPAYLQNAVNRLNSWLQSQPALKDFQEDSEWGALREKISALSTQAKEASRLFDLFQNAAAGSVATVASAPNASTPEAQPSPTEPSTATAQRTPDASAAATDPAHPSPTEQDTEQLLSLLVSIEASCRELADTIDCQALKEYAEILATLREKLEKTKEFQFADSVESFKAAILQFELQPWFQLDSFARGMEHVERLMNLTSDSFCPGDADYFKQSVWFNNIFHWASGKQNDDITMIKNLFDWTIQNIPLNGHQPGIFQSIQQMPWQTILLSQGTSRDRSLVFMELLRQNRFDSFLIEPVTDDPDVLAKFPDLVGVCLKDQVYLFLPELGMPIPAKEGLTFDQGLSFSSVATLEEAAADDSILRRLDLSEEERFPVTAEMLQQVVARVLTTPFSQSQRMMRMEEEFGLGHSVENEFGEANDKSTLLTPVFATPYWLQKERIAQLVHIQSVTHCWDEFSAIFEQTLFPMESEMLIRPYLFEMEEGDNLSSTIRQDKSEDIPNESGQPQNRSPLRSAQNIICPLWMGKVLYFKGTFTGEYGAAYWLQQGRISDRELKSSWSSLGARTNEFREHVQELSQQEGKSLSQEELQAITQQYVDAETIQHTFKVFIKTASRYYLALISMATDNEETALTQHLLDKSLLNATTWKSGTLYLMGNIYEKSGDYPKAVNAYRSMEGDSRYGGQLRAKWLESLAPAPQEAPNTPQEAPSTPQETPNTPQETPNTPQ